MEIGDRNWGGRCAALLGSSGFAGYQNSYLLSHISYLCDNKKRLSSHPWDERRILPRYHPDSRQKRRALVAPVTEGGPAVSPRRLPGEPNRTSAVWLAAGGQTSLGGVSRLFSRSSLITINTYSTETGQMQAPIRRNSADRGGNFQLKSRPSTRSSTWMADTSPSVMKKEMCLQ